MQVATPFVESIALEMSTSEGSGLDQVAYSKRMICSGKVQPAGTVAVAVPKVKFVCRLQGTMVDCRKSRLNGESVSRGAGCRSMLAASASG